MIDVDLLPEKNIRARQDNKIRLYSIICSVVAIVLTVGVCGAVFFIDKSQQAQLAMLSQKNAALNQSLDGLSGVAGELLTLRKKAQGMAVVKDNNFDFSSAFGYVSGLLPEGVTFESVEIDDGGNVTAKLASGSVPIVAAYIAQASTDPKMKEAKLSGLRLSDDGKLLFTLGSLYGRPKKTSGVN